MSKASRLMLLLGVLLAVGGGGALFVYLQSLSQTNAAAVAEAAPVPVVVAAKDIPSFKPIVAEDLQVKPFPQDNAPAGAAKDATEVIGKSLSNPLNAGLPVLAAAAVTQGFSAAIPKDEDGKFYRAQAIFVDRLSVLNGLLVEGDKVDVQFTGTLPQLNFSEGQDGKYADMKPEAPVGKTIVQDVQVLKILDPAESNAQGAMIVPEDVRARTAPAEGEGGGEAAAAPAEGEDAPAAPLKGLWTVVLAVDAQEAELLRYAQLNGVTSLVMRAPQDDTRAQTSGVSQEILNSDKVGVPLPKQPALGQP